METRQGTYFQRNVYSDGMLLTAADMTNLQEYQDRKRMLLSRSLLGYGVVYGLAVSRAAKDRLMVRAGLALDREGREIYVPVDMVAGLEAVFPNYQPLAGSWDVCIDYAERTQSEGYILPGAEAGGNFCRCTEYFTLRAVSARQAEDICIARIRVAQSGSGHELQHEIHSPVDGFCPASGQQRDGMACGRLAVRTRPCAAGETAVFYSEEISHTLGPGPVRILLAAEEPTGAVYGRCSLFQDAPVLDTAVRVREDKGTFVAAALVRPGADGKPVQLRWEAWRL